MYVPAHFAMDQQYMWQLLQNQPYGDLVTKSDAGFDSTYLPFSIHREADGLVLLRAHLNRVNTQWQDEGEAMIIFNGSAAYISPNWCPSTAKGNSVAPTLDYFTVHAHGHFKAIDDPKFVKKHMFDLSKQVSGEWDLNTLDMAWVDRMVAATVGVEFTVDRFEAKAKMNQNMKPEDVAGIIEGLKNSGAPKDLVQYLEEVSLPHAKARDEMLDRIRSFTLVARQNS